MSLIRDTQMEAADVAVAICDTVDALTSQELQWRNLPDGLITAKVSKGDFSVGVTSGGLDTVQCCGVTTEQCTKPLVCRFSLQAAPGIRNITERVICSHRKRESTSSVLRSDIRKLLGEVVESNTELTRENVINRPQMDYYQPGRRLGGFGIRGDPPDSLFGTAEPPPDHETFMYSGGTKPAWL